MRSLPSPVPATGKINFTDAPNPLGTANPGNGLSGAMAADATLPMPALSQLTDVDPVAYVAGQVPAWDPVSGKFKPITPNSAPVPLWDAINNGVITLSRSHGTNTNDYAGSSGDYGYIGSGVEHFTFFRADKSITVNTIRFQTGSRGASGSTLARVGIYTVSGDTKKLVASCANKTSFGNSFSQVSCALTSPYALVAGTVYAIGNIQVASTPAGFIGQWINSVFLGGQPPLAQFTSGGLTDLAATSTAASGHQVPIYYELVP